MSALAPLLLLLAADTGSLERGTSAVAEFHVDEAVRWLERARREGPYAYADHVRLYEQLGIALAYAGRVEEALQAFLRMLSLDPTHTLSYSLSPKATLVFERALAQWRSGPAPALDLGVPRGKMVDDALPIDLDVLADPQRFLKQARLHYRFGEGQWQSVDLPLDEPTGRHRVVLPPPSPAPQHALALQLYLVVQDERGNEVLKLASAAAPREVPLGYLAPEPWYQRWWLWTGAAAVVIGGTATAVVLATRPEETTISARVIRP